MVSYECPNCGSSLAKEVWDVTREAERKAKNGLDMLCADFDSESEEDFEKIISCPQCKSPLTISGTASATVEIESNSYVDEIKANVPEGWSPPAEVIEAFFEKTPDEVTFTEARCGHCHRLDVFDGPKTARELMAEGWRITPLFPTYGTKCPDC